MVKNLVTRSQFAASCGVSAAAVTKACKSRLLPACSGKRVDADHPAAIAYHDKQTAPQTPEPAVGIDPLYEQAVAFFQGRDKPSAKSLRTEFKIGSTRADRILATIRAAGLLPVDSPTPPDPIPTAMTALTARVVSGQAKVKQTKKSEALANVNEDTGLHEVPADILRFADMTLRELIQRFGTDTAFCDWLTATKAIEEINGKRIKNAQAEGLLVSRELVRVGVIDVFNAALLRLMTDGAKTLATEVVMKHKAGADLPELEAHVSAVLGTFIKPVKAKAERTLRNA